MSAPNELAWAVPVFLIVPGDARPIAAELVDLSVRGLSLRTDEVIKLEGAVGVRFEVLPDKLCTARGSVLPSEEHGAIGIMFVSLNEALRDFVQGLEGLPPERVKQLLQKTMNPRIHIEG